MDDPTRPELDDVTRARLDLLAAHDAWIRAVRAADAAGYSGRAIARASMIGVSSVQRIIREDQ